MNGFKSNNCVYPIHAILDKNALIFSAIIRNT